MLLSNGGSPEADWLSAIGQLLSAAGTFAAVVVALAVARRDGRRQDLERHDREAGQARFVVGRVHRDDGAWWVRTTNHSGAPVFDVEVVDVRHGPGTAVSRVHDAPGAPAALTELAPGKTLDRALEAGVDDPTAGVVVLEFLDAAGLRWRREGTGQPARILGT